MNFLLIIAAICLVIILLDWACVAYLKLIRKNTKRTQYYKRNNNNYEPNTRSHPQNKSLKSSKDYRYLLTLLNGDHDGANRLVQFISDSYPDRNTQWCLEKAINDILRDRR